MTAHRAWGAMPGRVAAAGAVRGSILEGTLCLARVVRLRAAREPKWAPGGRIRPHSAPQSTRDGRNGGGGIGTRMEGARTGLAARRPPWS